MSKRHAFTLIELLVVISIIALLIAILLPALGAARNSARKLKSATQLRGLHQAIVIHSNDNKEFYTGLNAKGADLDSADCGNSGEGVTVEARYWVLLDGDYLTKDILISPGEVNPRETWINGDPITLRHYSYAMLSIAGTVDQAPDEGGRAAEWTQSLNTQAIVVSDRNTGRNASSGVESIHTSTAGDWKGSVLWNDNHVGFEQNHIFETRYGSGALNIDANQEGNDNLFHRAGDDDAYLIHQGD